MLYLSFPPIIKLYIYNIPDSDGYPTVSFWSLSKYSLMKRKGLFLTLNGTPILDPFAEEVEVFMCRDFTVKPVKKRKN